MDIMVFEIKNRIADPRQLTQCGTGYMQKTRSWVVHPPLLLMVDDLKIEEVVQFFRNHKSSVDTIMQQ